jgi:hypothetical protein
VDDLCGCEEVGDPHSYEIFGTLPTHCSFYVQHLSLSGGTTSSTPTHEDRADFVECTGDKSNGSRWASLQKAAMVVMVMVLF